MAVIKCSNCEEIIGNLESYYDFQGQCVCKTCKRRLDEQAQLVAENSVNIINETNELPIEISKYNSSLPLENNYQADKPNYFSGTGGGNCLWHFHFGLICFYSIY